MKATLDKIWTACARSVTIAWSYVLAAIGALLNAIDAGLGDAIGDPALKQQVSDAFKGDPAILGKILVIISVITIMARVRSKIKKS